MPIYDYLCPAGHRTERVSSYNEYDIICPFVMEDLPDYSVYCGKVSVRQIGNSTHIWKGGKPST